jgi:hypothetical protein
MVKGKRKKGQTTIYKTYKIISLKITLFLSVNTLTLSIVINTVIVTAETLSRNERGRFGALKSDLPHHFFRNACTKS